MNIYEVEEDDDIVEMKSNNQISRPNQSNFIGVNESDLMEFPNNANFPLGTSTNQSALDYSQLNDRSVRYSQL